MLTKMNIFYAGVNNPVNIVVADVPPERVAVSISNGTITKKPDIYYVYVKEEDVGKTTTIKVGDGDTTLASYNFRVKRVPDPVPVLLDRTEGVIPKNVLLTAAYIEAELQNFEFEAVFTVTHFKMSATIGNTELIEPSNSNKITAKQKALIRKIPTGEKLYITDIKAQGPGSTRQLRPMVFTIR